MPDSRQCHGCGKELSATDRVGRRDACLQCGADLHCCLNCQFYEPAMNNQCREPQAERQVDKEVGNFCDYFAFQVGARRAQSSSAAQSAKQRLAALFAKKPV